MSSLFNQHLFVPRDLKWFDHAWACPTFSSWAPERLKSEASLWRECAITNFPVGMLLNALVAPPWSAKLELEVPEGLADWKAFVVPVDRLLTALAPHEVLSAAPDRLARKIVEVTTRAGWPADEARFALIEHALRSPREEVDPDDVPLALATAWAQRGEALRHAANRSAPLVCVLWRH